jgi:hypothetical protein
MQKRIKWWMGLVLLAGSVALAGPTKEEKSVAFQTRGVVLVPADLTLTDWPERAAIAGLTTVSLHLSPSIVEKFIDSPQGKAFLEKCARLGLNVEYELHAARELLPRSLFAAEPDCFRMDEKGARANDANLCVHSERALEIASANALRIARKLKPTTSRYHFWGDDGGGWCRCPKCREYSDSDQALLLENRLIRALRTTDPNAQLAHLAYQNTMEAPHEVKPESGVFLEFAPIRRRYTEPIARQTGRDTLQLLEANLKVFPAETAQVLEYWLDASMFSSWTRPAKQLPWHRDVMTADARSYAQMGIRHVTTFAVYIDADYVARFGEPAAIREYGDILRATAAAKETKTYSVVRVPKGGIRLDGRLDEPEWKQAVAETGFSFPWEKANAPPTVFKALTDDEFLYFAFDVHDETPVVEEAFTNKTTVAKEDRVELFFAPDDTLAEYFCIEIDPLGRILDYAASYHRKFDYSWTFPRGVKTATVRTKTGYVVEGRISLSALESLRMPSLRSGAGMKVGVFRADLRHGKDGQLEEHWISWVAPKVETPDFHTYSAFGEFR